MRTLGINLRNLALGGMVVLGWQNKTLADEGFWLPNSPPIQHLREKYQVNLRPEWLEHLRRSCVRFDNGGSGAFISAQGLVITNQHVGAEFAQQISNDQHNYIRDGFWAASRAEEVPCQGLEIDVLESIQDCTDRVNAAIPPNATPGEALQARRNVIAEIETESHAKTGLRSDVVTFFEGASYQLYRYKRYTDVRLVFVPEEQAAYFGGDSLNFEYPRYALDICLFRVYENGNPLHVDDYLQVNARGPQEHELVFVAGNPGSTQRDLTIDEISRERDLQIPSRLSNEFRLEVLYSTFGSRSSESQRRVRGDLLETQNDRKRLLGELAGLQTPFFFHLLEERKNALAKAVGGTPGQKTFDSAIEKIKQADARDAANWNAYSTFEGDGDFYPFALKSRLFQIARNLLRAAEERPKPNGTRLPEYQNAALPALEVGLFSEAPIYDDLEGAKLGDGLTQLVIALGAEDELTKQILSDKSPRERGLELVSGTKLRDVQFRHRIYEGGTLAIAEANDPMLRFSALVDPRARAARAIHDQNKEVKEEMHAELSRIAQNVGVQERYPDATFTLRLGYGTVEGYQQLGEAIPAFSTFSDLFVSAAKSAELEAFKLPLRFLKHQSDLNPDTHFNFVCTVDIVGGSSGSPVINREGELVGIIFDGNIQSLSTGYLFTDFQARAIAVDSSAIVEALQKIYRAQTLVDEIMPP